MDVVAPGDSDQEEGIVMMSTELEASCHKRHNLTKDYYVLDTLGEGSFAQVKVALHLLTQTLVAIKILQRGTRIDLLVMSEIDIMKSLYHSNIIQLLQVFQRGQKTYLVMEYAARGSLSKHISKCGRLDEKEASSIFSELCLAVSYIHSQNIAHRDIKAENVLLDWEGHVKLIDFGLSRRLASGEKFKGFCGTAQYCAPEVFGHTEYDGLPADIWSMGVLLYYCVTGNLPFTETVHAKIKYQILSMSCWIPYHLSPELRDLLKRLLTIEPTMRPSIKEILAHLWLHHDPDTLRSSEEIPAYPDPCIAFDMYLMGYNIQELRDAMRERKYNRAMATYLIIKKKNNWQPQFYHDIVQRGTLRPTEASNYSWPVRRITTALSLQTFTLHTLAELPGDRRKDCKRRHSVPCDLSSLKCSFLENTSPLQGLLPHTGKGTFREKNSMPAKTSSSKENVTAVATILTSSTRTTCSLFTSSPTSTFENTPDVDSLNSESKDKSSNTFWRSTTRSPFSSEKIQEENAGTISLKVNSLTSREPEHQVQLRRQCQDVPRVPLRRWGWKGLKKRISKALRSLCCCLPVTNNKIMAANEDGF